MGRTSIRCGTLLLFTGLATLANAQPISILEQQSKDLAFETSLEAQRASLRWSHAKELLGKHYQKSIVKSGENILDLDKMISQWTTRALPKNWKESATDISKAILEESQKYGFDPVFLMAVIQNESSFRPDIIGPCGEIGLMQLTRETAEWVTRKYGVSWKGVKSLKDPTTNIRIGAAYMAYLREKFEFHSQLYLAAYNMGSSNVQRALEKQVMPKQYASRVMHHYMAYYSKLKHEIGKPTSNDKPAL